MNVNLEHIVKFEEGAEYFSLPSSPDYKVKLIASNCKDCGYYAFPPKKICSSCYSENCEQVEIESTGKIVAATIIRMPPMGFDKPYAVGYVDFPEGFRVFSQIDTLDQEKLKPGSPVEITLIKLSTSNGKKVVGYGFTPIKERIGSKV
jgi:uncharacterized OB-fold protein